MSILFGNLKAFENSKIHDNLSLILFDLICIYFLWIFKIFYPYDHFISIIKDLNGLSLSKSINYDDLSKIKHEEPFVYYWVTLCDFPRFSFAHIEFDTYLFNRIVQNGKFTAFMNNVNYCIKPEKEFADLSINISNLLIFYIIDDSILIAKYNLNEKLKSFDRYKLMFINILILIFLAFSGYNYFNYFLPGWAFAFMGISESQMQSISLLVGIVLMVIMMILFLFLYSGYLLIKEWLLSIINK